MKAFLRLINECTTVWWSRYMFVTFCCVNYFSVKMHGDYTHNSFDDSIGEFLLSCRLSKYRLLVFFDKNTSMLFNYELHLFLLSLSQIKRAHI